MTNKYIPHMKVQYQEQIVKELKQKFNYTNDMQVPKLDKIVLNMGLGDAVAESKKADVADANEKLADTDQFMVTQDDQK